MSISSCPRLEELYLAKLFKTFNDPQEGHCRVGKSKYLETAIQWRRGPAVELADLHLAACFLLFLVADYGNSQGTTGFSPSQTAAPDPGAFYPSESELCSTARRGRGGSAGHGHGCSQPEASSVTVWARSFTAVDHWHTVLRYSVARVTDSLARWPGAGCAGPRLSDWQARCNKDHTVRPGVT